MSRWCDIIMINVLVMTLDNISRTLPNCIGEHHATFILNATQKNKNGQFTKMVVCVCVCVCRDKERYTVPDLSGQ